MMSVDFSPRSGATGAASDADTFAPTPIWARDSRKRRGLGGGRRADSTAAAPIADTYDRPDEPLLAPEGEFSPATAPRRAARTRNNTSLLVAGSVAVIAVAAFAGWYATRPQEGVAEMTPGAAAPASVTKAPTVADATATGAATPAAPAPTQLAAANTTASPGGEMNSPPASAHPGRATPVRTSSHHVSRARSAKSRTAADASGEGVNASAVEGGASPTYSGSAPTPAPISAAPSAATPMPAQGGATASSPMNATPSASAQPAAPATSPPPVASSGAAMTPAPATTSGGASSAPTP